MNKFEFSIKGESVDDLKSLIGSTIVNPEVKKEEAKEEETKCPVCGSINVMWLDETSAYSWLSVADGQTFTVLQGNCQHCNHQVVKSKKDEVK